VSAGVVSGVGWRYRVNTKAQFNRDVDVVRFLRLNRRAAKNGYRAQWHVAMHTATAFYHSRQNERERSNQRIVDALNAAGSPRAKVEVWGWVDKLLGTILADLPYQEFLRTSYWHAVRDSARESADHRCQLCGCSNRELHVHHKTYEHRGREYDHMNDLIVLCEPCHAKFHDKPSKASSRASSPTRKD